MSRAFKLVLTLSLAACATAPGGTTTAATGSTGFGDYFTGDPLAILTNKPVRFSVRLIAGLGLSGHFFQIYGGNSFEKKKPHPIGIERLIAESGADRAATVMVGDSAVDVLTARAASVSVYSIR